MRRLILAAISLSLSLAGVTGVALAQEKNVQGITTNADGSHVTSTAGVNPTANGEGGTIIYGDINTGPGYTVVGPPSVVQSGSTAPPAPVAAPAPAPETAPVTTTAESVPAETSAATAEDLDADNYPDALEWELGLDGNNPDSDGDGVADGDELNLYATDPTVSDTDGDGVSDGEELFGSLTDPLVWDEFTAEAGAVIAQQASAGTEEIAQVTSDDVVALAQDTTEDVTAIDGDAAALGPGSASASPGSVTRGSGSGAALLGPDGNYNVTEVAPPNVTVSGDTGVVSPPPAAAAPESTVAGCSSYLSWYDAQVAYEAAGMTDADPAIVAALDPDYDGIACEEVM